MAAGSGGADGAVAAGCSWVWRWAMSASRLEGSGWDRGAGGVADEGGFFSGCCAVAAAAMEAVGETVGFSGRVGVTWAEAGAGTGAEAAGVLSAAGAAGADVAGASATRSAFVGVLPDVCPSMTIGMLAGDRVGGGTSNSQGNAATATMTRRVAPISRWRARRRTPSVWAEPDSDAWPEPDGAGLLGRFLKKAIPEKQGVTVLLQERWCA